MPYSLANLSSDNKYGIFELGMSSKGEIDNLVNLVKPHIAIITNIGPAHLENFKNNSRGKIGNIRIYIKLMPCQIINQTPCKFPLQDNVFQK